MKHGTPLSVGATIRAGKLMLPVLWTAGLATAVLSLVTPRQIGHLTDLFIDDGASVTPREVNVALLLIVGAQFLIAVLTFCDRAVTAQFREKVLRSAERFLFSRVLRLAPEFYRTRTVENITTRCLDDAWYVVDFRCRGLVTLPLALVSVATFGVYMIYHNWFLACLMLALSLLGGYFLLFDRPIQRVNRAARQSWDELRERANETVSGVETLRDNHAFEYGSRRVEEPIVRQSDLETVRSRWMAAFDALGPLVNMFQLIVIYWIGAALCMSSSSLTSIAGESSWGQVIQFALISTLFQKPVNEIFSFLKKWRLVRENSRRVAELLEFEEKFADGSGLPLKDDTHDIEFDEVTVSTDDGRRIINRVSVDIGYGHHTAIAGTAGSGKSTLMALLTSGAELEEGVVQIGGTAVDQMDRRALAEVVGKVPQFPKIFSGTIRDNLLLSLRRPGVRFLDDSATRISLDTLAGIETREDLERRLLETVRLVDFERDVFRMALDHHLGADERFAKTKKTITKLRPAIRAAAEGLGPELVGWFEVDAYVPYCTLCENLIGPTRRAEDLNDDEFDTLLSSLSEGDALHHLLQLGYQQFQSDKELAARLSKHTPGLIKLVSSLNHQDADRLELPAANCDRFTQLSKETQKALLRIALNTEANHFSDYFPQDAAQFVLELRRRLSSRFPSQSWTMHDEPIYVDTLSVRDNLLGGRVNSGIHRADLRVEETVFNVLVDNQSLYPILLCGLDVVVARDGLDLSGGQRQKLALGRALLKNPRILLLDEATASLDELSESKIMETLGREFRSKTVVSISHRLGPVHGFDRFVVMDGGQKLQEGSFHELAQQQGLFQDLLRGSPPGSTPAIPDGSRDGSRVASGRGIDYLRVCPLFANLDSDRLIAIRAMSKVVSCPAGDTIFNRGDMGDELFVVCKGVVEFFATPKSGYKGDEELVDACGPGEAFGELAVFGDMRRTLGARARDPVQLLVLHRDDVFRLMDADPTIALSFLRMLARRIGSIRSDIYDDTESRARTPEGER